MTIRLRTILPSLLALTALWAVGACSGDDGYVAAPQEADEAIEFST